MSPPAERFARRFGHAPTVIARAPGRVNLIGEHTDYNEGLALPIAIGRAVLAVAAPRTDASMRISSDAFSNEMITVDLSRPRDANPPEWARLPLAVAAGLRDFGARLEGFDLSIESDLPIGAGLSSSAAVGVAVGLALAHLAGEPLATNELIDLCCAAERDASGVPCGVLDQSASLLARAGHALLLDCRTREVEHISLGLSEAVFVVVDGGDARQLRDSQYAERRAECAAAAAYFRQYDRDVRALRDVPVSRVRAHAAEMDPRLAARAMHVATENERVTLAVESLRRGDAAGLGELLRASHRSLRDDFEASSPGVDRVVAWLDRRPQVWGSRLMGGGFGGVALALARADGARELLAAAVEAGYRAFAVTAERGAELVLS